MTSSKNADKALALEHKGDQYRAKNKIKKAYACYQAALDLNTVRVELYDKLLGLHDLVRQNWTQEDFAVNLQWTMKKQELLNPDLKRIHSRATPEYKAIADLIKKLMSAPAGEAETPWVEAIAAYGEQAVYPLVDFLMRFKEIGMKKAAEKT